MRRVLLLSVAAAIGAPAALASHVPGGFYRGTHSNGGEVTMQLTADGNLQFFRAADLRLGGSCPPSIGINIPQGFPITNHQLNLIGSTLSVSATFPTVTTARGTMKLSCSSVTLNWTATLVRTGAAPPASTTPSSAPQGNALAPGFRNSGIVRLERKAGVAYIRAIFRACNGTPPFRLVVRQRRSVSGSFVAESRFTLKLPAGTPFTVPEGAPCRKFSVAWRLAPKFFGGGLLVITLRVRDAGGRESPPPGYLVRSPKK